MPAAPPALSPAAEVVRRSLLDLPAPDRAAVLEAVTQGTADAPAAADPWADVGRDPIPPSVLAALERDADEVAAGTQRAVPWEEVRANAERLAKLPDDRLTPRQLAARERGRAAARRAGGGQ